MAQRSAAENLAANTDVPASTLAKQAELNAELARVLYPGLSDSSAKKTWGDFWLIFNETSKQAGMGFATGGGPVGAVVAGAAALITGVIKAAAEGKLRRQAAVRWAYQLGITDAEDFPSFIVDVQGMGLRERVDLIHELNRQLSKKALSAKKRKKLEQRKDAVIVLIQLEAIQAQRMQQVVIEAAAMQREQAGTSVTAQALAARQAKANRSTLWWLGVAATIGGLGLAFGIGGK